MIDVKPRSTEAECNYALYCALLRWQIGQDTTDLIIAGILRRHVQDVWQSGLVGCEGRAAVLGRNWVQDPIKIRVELEESAVVRGISSH